MDIGEFSEKSNKFCKVGGGENYLPWTSIPWGGGGGRITYPGLASHGGGGGVALLLVTSCY